MTLDDRTYYLRRALQEDTAAQIATCSAARRRHLELAAAYRLRCQFNAEPDRLTVSEVIAGPSMMAPAA